MAFHMHSACVFSTDLFFLSLNGHISVKFFFLHAQLVNFSGLKLKIILVYTVGRSVICKVFEDKNLGKTPVLLGQ